MITFGAKLVKCGVAIMAIGGAAMAILAAPVILAVGVPLAIGIFIGKELLSKKDEI